MTEPPPRPEQPRRSHLLQQDIAITRVDASDPTSRVVAHVHCTRRRCAIEVRDCADCQHFARIEVHEAGYVLLCQQEDAANVEQEGSAREQEEPEATRAQDEAEP